MSKPPISWTSEDRAMIVADLRRQRANFIQAEQEAKASGKRVNSKNILKKASLEELGDLDLEL